ncbi:TBC domain protein, putative [Plasmodium ovale wallikeri]|uniref:TBC domain protein, putative n=1 Tax=Plasmodium ovale wallikeri TaxID=864142 RepID=A0A1A8ZVA0_PLAOA|nr:TBC domain protein, putative [Plasmodium ovale wallikeri]SBT48269.1 TBC domain protein, putative [Plasmodium ovale wallikeri]
MEYKLEFLSYLLIFKKKNERIAKFDEQIKICINIFEKVVIDENDLIYLFEKNILDMNPCIRSMCWKLALKHLSLNTKKWNEELTEKKKLYEDYVKCFVINPLLRRSNNAKKEEEGEEEEEKEEGVSPQIDEESTYNLINSELFSQINKDTFRTRPELSFFNLNPQQTINNNINILNSLINVEDFEDETEEIPSLVNISVGLDDKNETERTAHFCDSHDAVVNRNPGTTKQNDSPEEALQKGSLTRNGKDALEEATDTVDVANAENALEQKSTRSLGEEVANISTNGIARRHKKRSEKDFLDVCDIVNPRRHYDLLCRILFIYAKIHPYVKYVQGMNEILAPLYFIIFNDPLCNCSIQGEADTFFCFTELMQRQKDVFCEGLDNTDDGINGKLKKFSLLLKIKEYEIWKKLYILKIETQYYALKWILLLLTQEFDMADSIILYDHFIINDNEDFILYICLVICMKLKTSLLCGNFTVNLKLLQNIPPFDPYDIIYEAKNLMNSDFKKCFNITDIYNNYISEKKRRRSMESLKNSNTDGTTSSAENLSNLDESDSSSGLGRKTSGMLLNNLRSKSIVENIKNYISNKMDVAKRSNEKFQSDQLRPD